MSAITQVLSEVASYEASSPSHKNPGQTLLPLSDLANITDRPRQGSGYSDVETVNNVKEIHGQTDNGGTKLGPANVHLRLSSLDRRVFSVLLIFVPAMRRVSSLRGVRSPILLTCR